MLLDTNIVVYAIQPQYPFLHDLIVQNLPNYSAISFVESLGFHRITRQDETDIRRLLARLPRIEIDQPVLDQAVALRQQRKMSLGDAIIAATALVHNKTLITRNIADFAWIAGLKLLDPLAAPPPPPAPQPPPPTQP